VLVEGCDGLRIRKSMSVQALSTDPNP
jgi:hypothetical protein